MSGPLSGIRVLEIPNIGPLQHAGMVLSDLGAEVLRLDRKSFADAGSGLQGPYTERSVLDRGRRSAAIDLKHPDAADLVLALAERADVIVEGFRPGVAERLGIGPEPCRARNPKLVYGRMTGWGQHGPMATQVGHDINYISLAGVLHHLGTAGGPPVPPLNLVGDFGGGSMLLVVGVLAALVERGISGEGQVVDAAMIDGSALLMSAFYPADLTGSWGPRGTNLLDGGAHFYGTYECADGQWISIAAIEPEFYTALRERLGLDDLDGTEQYDKSQWAPLQRRIAAVFATKSRAEWIAHMEGHEVCFAPVLSMRDAREHPHNRARNTFVTVAGVEQPAPAPRFSRTQGAVRDRSHAAGADTDTALADWGIDAATVARLRNANAIG